MFITEEIEWADAASSCVRHGKRHSIQRKLDAKLYEFSNCYNQTVFCCEGGILASIEDPSEEQFIKSNVEVFQDSHRSFWIGLYKTHKGMITLFAPTR